MALYLTTLAAIFIISRAQSYWFSSNRFAWEDASAYCQQHCNSYLASIHQQSDMDEIKNLIDTDTPQFDVWIGLRSTPLQATDYIWSDASPWDFGTNTSGSVYPWAHNEPTGNGSPCVKLLVDQNYQWNHWQCSTKLRFVCNSCEGALEKYIIYPSLKNQSDALDFCQSTLETSLASIHSDRDMNETTLLCKNYGYSSCWIGLQRYGAIDPVYGFPINNTYIWSDGTSLDYGDWVNQPPWYNGEPNVLGWEGGERTSYDCIKQGGADFLWNDTTCDEQNTFICNKPSEFCYGDQWTQLPDIGGSIKFEDVGCDIKSADHGVAVITKKKWDDSNYPIKIEYTFKVNEVLSTESCEHCFGDPSYNEVGITLHIYNGSKENTVDANVCEYQFYGISIKDHTVYAKRFKWDNGSMGYADVDETSMQGIHFEYDKYHTIEMEVNQETGVYWGVRTYFDGVLLGTYPPWVPEDYDRNKYFGIRNSNMSITGKSFYISGTPQIINGTQFDQCLPTNTPTSSFVYNFVL